MSTHARAGNPRFFHLLMSILVIALSVWGFHHFYLEGRAYPGRPLTPPIRTLVIAHGALMAAWVIFFFVQPLLIVLRKPRLHMVLGPVGALLAAAIVVLGYLLGVAGARVSPPDLKIWGYLPRQWLIVPTVTILVFGAFVVTGIVARRRPRIHRSMMLLGTLAATGAAMARIDAINALYLGTVWERLWGPFFGMLVLGLLIVVIKWIWSRSLDRWLAGAWLAQVIVFGLAMHMATSAAWDRVAGWMLG